MEWGEVPSQLACGVLIVAQVLAFQRHAGRALLGAWLALAAATTAALMHAPQLLGDANGLRLLQVCKSCNVAVTVGGKLPQIAQNQAARSSGEPAGAQAGAQAGSQRCASFQRRFAPKSRNYLTPPWRWRRPLAHAGELSPTTTSLAVLGSVVRFYTLLKSERLDPLMLVNQGTSLLSNGTILGQIVWFGGGGAPPLPA